MKLSYTLHNYSDEIQQRKEIKFRHIFYLLGKFINSKFFFATKNHKKRGTNVYIQSFGNFVCNHVL
jgi:hypothetical protein